uniref:Uncharacterized protein n=1 Tax=Heterorhabditis bacteriophora TaxID=37862 RepID=A0A1I7XA02_HETBA
MTANLQFSDCSSDFSDDLCRFLIVVVYLCFSYYCF